MVSLSHAESAKHSKEEGQNGVSAQELTMEIVTAALVSTSIQDHYRLQMVSVIFTATLASGAIRGVCV